MKGRLVTNTGPLMALASIACLDLLLSLFTSVHVPQAVHDEMVQGGGTQAGLEAYRQADWIIVVPAVPVDPLLSTILDQGEAAVIALARSLGADMVLIDERKARKIARNIYRLPVMGSARVLVDGSHAQTSPIIHKSHRVVVACAVCTSAVPPAALSCA